MLLRSSAYSFPFGPIFALGIPTLHSSFFVTQFTKFHSILHPNIIHLSLISSKSVFLVTPKAQKLNRIRTMNLWDNILLYVVGNLTELTLSIWMDFDFVRLLQLKPSSEWDFPFCLATTERKYKQQEGIGERNLYSIYEIAAVAACDW